MGDSRLRPLWFEVSVTANGLIKSRMNMKDCSSAKQNFAAATATLKKEFPDFPNFTEWDVLRLER